MGGNGRRPWRRCVLAAILAGAALLSSAAAAQAGPLSRDGMWIWYVSRSGGSAEAIAKKAKRHDIRLVLIKSSDGAGAWSQFTPSLVKGLQRRGMTVCAWQFVYGTYPVSEAKRGAEAARKGADCLVIDAESHYEGRYAAADKYIGALRKRVGRDYPVGFTSFPWVDYHSSLPYSVFLGRGGASFNLPQVYWKTIGTSVDNALAHTYLWNLPYDRPILPLGQTYENPPGKDLTRFRRLSAGYGAKGVSWWSWQETSSREWNRLDGKVHRPYPDPARNFPRLARGSRGDTVLLLQQLLRAAGRKVGADGTFGSETRSVLKRYQRGHGLADTGVADKPTWRELRKRRPERIRWSRRGNPGFLKTSKLEADPPSALELPSTPGRP